ncbi:hypothetical protein GCM10029964_043100 [Kibdelosporangium lantanae]
MDDLLRQPVHREQFRQREQPTAQYVHCGPYGGGVGAAEVHERRAALGREVRLGPEDRQQVVEQVRELPFELDRRHRDVRGRPDLVGPLADEPLPLARVAGGSGGVRSDHHNPCASIHARMAARWSAAFVDNATA